MVKIAGFFGTPTPTSLHTLENFFRSSENRDYRPTVHNNESYVFITNNAVSFASYHDQVSVLFSGAIFNRNELDGSGSDAEVFIALYLIEGLEGALNKINGDFSVAIFDKKMNAAFLARDRFGICPLYWVETEEGLAFSTRPLPLAMLLSGGVELNRGFVARYAGCHYRYFDNSPEQSPYRNVSQVPPAKWVCFSNGLVSTGTYWSLTEQDEYTDSEEVLAERYRVLLRDSVSLRLKRFEYPAFTLSGGMDSSSVLACATELSGNSFKVYSSVYTDKTFDESEDIQAMRQVAAKDWHPILIENPDVFDMVEKMIQAHHEPVATATWLSHYMLCKESSKNCHDALFGGLGGDELNAGEYEYFFYLFADLISSGRIEEFDHEVSRWIKYHDHPVFRKSYDIAIKTVKRVTDQEIAGKCMPDLVRLQRYLPVVNKEYFDLTGFEPLMDAPFKSYLKNRMFQDLTRETTPCCLRAEERQAGAFGMQSVDPFLDYRLVEFMFRVPNHMKIRSGVTKILLRKAMKGILPEETRTRVKKTGWNAPAHVWFSGNGLNQLYDLVLSQDFRESDIYVQSEVLKVLDSHKRILSEGANADNHMMFLWQVLNLHCWLKSIKNI